MRLRTSLLGMVAPPILGLAVACTVSLATSRLVSRYTGHLRQVVLPQLQTAYELQAAFQNLDAQVNRAPAELEIANVQNLQTNAALAGAELTKLLRRLSETAKGQPSLERPLELIKPRLVAYDQAAGKVFAKALQLLPIDAAAALEKEATPARSQVAGAVGELILSIRKTTDTATFDAHLASQRGSQWLAVFAGAVTLFAVALAFFLARRLLQQISTTAETLAAGAEQTVSAAGQVSSSSQSLAEGASEQAASLEETSSSLEEMSSMTQRNAENAAKVKDLGGQARAAGDAAVADMQAMGTAMNAIKASSDDIAKIIKTVDEIAFQTNILALNAAVEAARAGEAGAGFAVVADEVRSLAQRCAQAAKETAVKIEDSVQKSAHGVAISAKVAQSLQEIVGKARQVDELAAEVAGASREQTRGINQINTAVSQMDKVTQSNAANAEENASAGEELNAQADALREAARDLLRLVNGGKAAQLQTAEAAHARRESVVKKPAAPAALKGKAAVHGNGGDHPIVPAMPAPKPEFALAMAGGCVKSEFPAGGGFKD